jgi:hypothetical protein
MRRRSVWMLLRGAKGRQAGRGQCRFGSDTVCQGFGGRRGAVAACQRHAAVGLALRWRLRSIYMCVWCDGGGAHGAAIHGGGPHCQAAHMPPALAHVAPGMWANTGPCHTQGPHTRCLGTQAPLTHSAHLLLCTDGSPLKRAASALTLPGRLLPPPSFTPPAGCCCCCCCCGGIGPSAADAPSSEPLPESIVTAAVAVAVDATSATSAGGWPAAEPKAGSAAVRATGRSLTWKGSDDLRGQRQSVSQ